MTVPGSPPVNFSVEEIVKLIEELTRTYPAVNLSVSPNPVVEGLPITVTATLSEAAENSVTIPLNVTAGAADASDYGSTGEYLHRRRRDDRRRDDHDDGRRRSRT